MIFRTPDNYEIEDRLMLQHHSNENINIPIYIHSGTLLKNGHEQLYETSKPLQFH